MKTITLITLPLCVLYFIVGIILVWLKIFDHQEYLNGAGIVGAIASVLGLLSFARPALTRDDIKSIETESLAKLGEISSEIKNLETARAATASEINDLEIKKKEMELLVRKASMSLFLREQHKYHEKKILDHIKNEQLILDSLSELKSLNKKIKALDEEIQQDENVDMLLDVVGTSMKRDKESPLEEAISSSPVMNILYQVTKVYVDAFRKIL